MKTVIFNEDTKLIVLKMLKKDVDEDGFIIQASTGERVLAPDGSEVKLRHFAGIRKGSEIFITDDLPSLLEHAGGLATDDGVA